MSHPLAETIGATHRFGHVVAVDRVDLAIGPGEVVGLIGANGAGKTTLIRMLLGLLAPTAGSVRLFGEAPTRAGRRRLGYVPQSLGLYDDLTPVENLAFSTAVFGGEPAHLPADLAPFGSITVGRLPLGVQRRMAFAQVLAHQPELLVLDEPTSGVDALARARLWEQIRGAADGGVGALVSTHHFDEAEECDRLVVMAAGSIVAQGSIPQIVGASRVTVVDAADWAGAFSAIERAGLPVALVGRSLRVVGTQPPAVLRALGPLPAQVRESPATLEERFFQLAATPRA